MSLHSFHQRMQKKKKTNEPKSILKICGETLAINLEIKRAGQITISDDRIKLRIRKNNQ